MRIVTPYITSFLAICIVFSGCTPNIEANKQNTFSAWEIIGPGGGGATFLPTFSYTDPDVFLIRCDMTGSYLTRDGGHHFRQINFAGAASCFAFDPNDQQTMYIASNTLNMSKDGGNAWFRIFPSQDRIKSEQFIGDHAELEIETLDSTLVGEINAVLVDPLNSGTVYFTMGPDLFYSVDSGLTWEKRDVYQNIDYLYTNKDVSKDIIYLFSDSTIFQFEKASKIISSRSLPEAMLPAFSFSAGKIKDTNQVIFYALHQLEQKDDPYAFTNGEVWISLDYGVNWEKSGNQLITNNLSGIKPSLSRIVCAEFDAGKAYVICDRYEEKSGDKNSKIWYGALKTADGGKSWNWVWKAGGGSGRYGVQDAIDVENLTDAWVHKAFGSEFIQLMDVGVSPTNGDIAVVTDWYRTMKSSDGGENWTQVYSNSNPDGKYTSNGMDVTNAYNVHFDPFDDDHIAVSYTDIGYFHSYDRGKSWSRSVEGVPIGWVNTCYDIAFDPDVKGKLWSGWSSMHDFPRGKMTRNPNWKNSNYVKGGISVSKDGGQTWTPTIQGMDENSLITSVLIDTTSAAGNRTLYVSSYNKGVFKSTDDGKTWTLKNKGIEENTCAFRITQSGNGDLFLVISPTPMHKNGKAGRGFYSGAVYRSTDHAESWTKLSIADGSLFPNEVVPDPKNPDVLYLACWSNIHLSDLVGSGVTRETGGNEIIDMPGGIFKSEDGGKTWKSIFGKEHHVYGVTIDPYHPGRLYCNTFDKAAYRSDDTGKSWQKIKGYDFHWGQRVIVDPVDHEKVFLSTYGSSVWHGYPEVESETGLQ